jgi:NAD(P)H-flavin reductase
MFLLREAEMIVPNLHRILVEAPDVARSMRPGQFVIVRAEEDGERIPLSVADWDAQKGTLTMVFMNIGRTTDTLASLEAGGSLPTVVGPLGNPLKLEPVDTVLLVGGCYGIGSLYPLAKAYKALGSRVVVVSEARAAFLLYWQEKYRAVVDRVFCITRDGSRGLRGRVDRLPEILAGIPCPDLAIANGCNYLLKNTCDATRAQQIPTWVSLNTIMIDGTGMCGVCRVNVGGETRFACVDGPYFDGHAIDWEELVQRRKSYLDQETMSMATSDCSTHHHGRGA